MTSNWPKKKDCEPFEINEFMNHYKNLPHGREFKIVKKQDKPDYILRDTNSKECFGVELTSVYLDDRSVPDIHKKTVNENTFKANNLENIEEDFEEIERYEQRLLKSISDKIQKAESGYDKNYPLILSIYVNEYISIYYREEHWKALEKKIDTIIPFCEVIFWPVDMPNNIFSIRKP